MFEEKYSDELVYDIANDKRQGMSIEMLAEKYHLTESQVEYIVYKRLRKENEERGLDKDAVVSLTVVDSKPEEQSTSASITVSGVTSSGEVNLQETPTEVPAPPTSWFKRVWRFWFG